jgi:hypothetical protein
MELYQLDSNKNVFPLLHTIKIKNSNSKSMLDLNEKGKDNKLPDT